MIGFAVAAADAKRHLGTHRKLYQTLNARFRQALTCELAALGLPAPLFLGHPKHQLANFCPVSFPGLDAERLIYRLEAQEIYLSTGAACAANKGTKSHVLTAIGLSDPEIAGSLRLSFGAANTLDQAEPAAQALAAAVAAEAARQQCTTPATAQSVTPAVSTARQESRHA